MTELSIQSSLFDKFMTLNSFSGKTYIDFDTKGNPKNVALPNKAFSQPTNNRWFRLWFRCNAPIPVGISGDSQDEFTGIFQIDVCTPTDTGEDEATAKYEYIKQLFNRGTTFGDVEIDKVYRSNTESCGNYYKTIITVYWTARIDK